MSQCPICNTEKHSIVLSNDVCLFLQKEQPILKGSGVIVPKQHRETVFDLTQEEWNSMFSLLQLTKQYIDGRFHPDAYNIGWNCGVTAGQKIPHAHLHIIPRYHDEPYAGKGIRHWINQRENIRHSLIQR